MKHYFVITILLCLTLVCCTTTASNNLANGNGRERASLSCFSITPPKGGGPSCDALCGAKGAVCVSLKISGAVNPGVGCGDAIDSLKGGESVAGCRCCAAGH